MTWEEFALARKVLLEEHIGTRVRQAKRDEDQAAAQARKSVTRGAR